MKLTTIAAKLGTLLLASSLCHAAPQVVDSFESANLLAPSTNTTGFKWDKTNYTSIVGMISGLPTRVWTGVTTNDIWSGHDFTCYDGTYCLRFRYAAGEYMSEQRFDLGTAQKDVWISYWLRVPTNFTHPSTSPNNQKFLALWMDGYEAQGDGPTVWLSFFNNGNGGSTLGVTHSTGQYTGAKAYQQQKAFITVPSDRGRWMQIVFHAKAATNRTSNDGLVETWRRWSGETNFTKFHEATSLNIAPPPNGPQGWKAGYLMGWANGAYAVETEWLLDKFIVSAESLLITDGSSSTSSPPTPPLLKIQ